jgi:hypothetical protein
VEVTVATVWSLLDQVRFWSVAFDGVTVAASCSVPPTRIDVLDLLRLTPVTAIGAAATITSQLALNPPSSVVTSIVAVPTAMAVTRPIALTVATSESVLDQDNL